MCFFPLDVFTLLMRGVDDDAQDGVFRSFADAVIECAGKLPLFAAIVLPIVICEGSYTDVLMPLIRQQSLWMSNPLLCPTYGYKTHIYACWLKTWTSAKGPVSLYMPEGVLTSLAADITQRDDASSFLLKCDLYEMISAVVRRVCHSRGIYISCGCFFSIFSVYSPFS